MKADDLFQKVTNDIIARLEDGDGWTKPWFNWGTNSNPRSLSTGKPYRGVNWVILTMESEDRGYKSNMWGTYNQWFAQGEITEDPETGRKNSTVHVKKGQKGTTIFFWQPGTKPSKKMLAQDPNAKPYLLATTFSVFNRDQIEGLPAEETVTGPVTDHERWAEADAYFEAIGAVCVEDGDRAYYAPAADRIAVPTIAQFPNRDHFYTTKAHEHVHWTGHESRLKRDLRNRFGSEAYAAEELVAELGAAFWGAQMGMEPAVRKDHAAYLANWLTILRNDKRAIVGAASKAQEAIDHLNKLAGFDVKTGEMVMDQEVAA